MDIPADPPPLTRAVALQNALWAALGSLLRYGLAGLTTLILARLLAPADFGLVALTIIAQLLIEHIATVGLHDALIQRPELAPADLDTAFWSLLAVSGSLALAVIALAPAVAKGFGQPVLAPLLACFALSSLLRALSIVPRALLTRRMDFRTPALIRSVGMSLSGAAAVILATLGAGAWSLLAQTLLLNAVITLGVWRAAGWRPRRTFSRPALRWLAGFAPSVSLFTLLDYATSNADDQLIGYRLGSAALGFYALAFSLVAWPVRDVLGGVSVVLYPVLARLQDDRARFRAAYLESLQLAALFAFPVLALLAISAPRLIPWLLGPRWTPIILVTQIMALGGLREATMMLNGLVYRALGRPALHTLLAAVTLACALPAFAIGLRWGIAGVAFFYVLVGLVLHPLSWWLLLTTLGLSLAEWLRALAAPAAATGVMALASGVMLHVAHAAWHLADGPALLISGLTAAVVYALMLYLLTPLALRRLLRTAWELAPLWQTVMRRR